MTKRVRVKVLMPPATSYQHAAVYAEGYAPGENARFAVVRMADDRPWLLVHRRTGIGVNSLFPTTCGKLGLAPKFAAAAALEAATHIDWAPFDRLPELQAGVKETYNPTLGAAGMALAPELRRIVAQAVGAS